MRSSQIHRGFFLLPALVASLSSLLSAALPALAVGAHASFHSSSSSSGHSSGGHSFHSSGYHSGSYHNYNNSRGWGGAYDDGQQHYYDEGHPVQTGASFSGPAHIDPGQYHYFVQEYHWGNSSSAAAPTGATATAVDYHWPTRASSTTQEPRNAAGTVYGVSSEPRASGLQYK